MSRGSRSAGRWSLRRGMVAIGAVGLTIALVAFGIGAVALQQLTQARVQLVDQLDPALLNAQQLSLALVNQETGVRGFAAGGDPAFLAPYQDGRGQEAMAVTALRGLAGPVGVLGPRLAAVVTAAGNWHSRYAEPTLAAVRAGTPAAAPPLQTVGKPLFDTLRVDLDAQRTALVTARRAARTRLDDAATGLVITSAAIAFALLALLVLLWVLARRVVAEPVERLADTVRVVADGEFGNTVRVTSGPAEIVELGADVESMRARIVAELRASTELNARLNQQTEDLSRSNRDLEQFAYVASHDLQEPLRKVTGFCELLAARYADQLDDRAGVYIGYAVDGARRMSVLISDLLAFSRVGRAAVSTEPRNLGELLAQALRNLDGAIEESAAVITHDELPTVPGEAALLTTLLQNLVGNALKFRGEQPPRVHVSAEADGEFWRLRVSDNGIGIDPAYAEKIFVIFQRLHPKDDYPGTGIGLALCRKIVEYHGGRIWLEPAEQPGATFGFTLPALAQRPAAPADEIGVPIPEESSRP